MGSRGLLGFVALLSAAPAALAQATPPPLPRLAPSARYAEALRQARSARAALERRVAPKYQGSGAAADVQSFVTKRLGPWLTQARKLHDEAASRYRVALDAATSADERVVVLAEVGEMSLVLSERTYRAGEAAMPRNVARGAELREAYLSALEDAVAPMREGAREALGRCAKLVEADALGSPAAKRCVSLHDEPFAIEPRRRATAEDVQRALRRARHQIRRCYERALAVEPGLSGDLRPEIELGPSGKVSRVKLGGSLAAHPVARCVAKLIEALPLPAPARGVKLVVSQPLKLEPR